MLIQYVKILEGKTQLEANRVFLDELFPYNFAESEKSVFCRCSYITKSPGSVFFKVAILYTRIEWIKLNIGILDTELWNLF